MSRGTLYDDWNGVLLKVIIFCSSKVKSAYEMDMGTQKTKLFQIKFSFSNLIALVDEGGGNCRMNG